MKALAVAKAQRQADVEALTAQLERSKGEIAFLRQQLDDEQQKHENAHAIGAASEVSEIFEFAPVWVEEVSADQAVEIWQNAHATGVASEVGELFEFDPVSLEEVSQDQAVEIRQLKEKIKRMLEDIPEAKVSAAIQPRANTSAPPIGAANAI